MRTPRSTLTSSDDMLPSCPVFAQPYNRWTRLVPSFLVLSFGVPGQHSTVSAALSFYFLLCLSPFAITSSHLTVINVGFRLRVIHFLNSSTAVDRDWWNCVSRKHPLGSSLVSGLGSLVVDREAFGCPGALCKDLGARYSMSMH